MVDVLREIEAVPPYYPAAPAGLSEDALLLISTAWARIEAYTAHRWSPRTVVWTVEGSGEWCPRLTPATITATERWDGTGWQSVELRPSPLGGFDLDGAGPYRITATVGSGTGAVPDVVSQACLRLAEYLASVDNLNEQDIPKGASSVSVSEGELSQAVTRAPAWQARAISNSGAGDLLRPYRRA